MAFLPLFDSIQDIGIKPSSVICIDRKKFEFYSACDSEVKYYPLKCEIVANVEDGQFVKLRQNECICERTNRRELPPLCFGIHESSGQIAFEEDGDICRVVFPDMLEWKLISFIIPHGVVPSVFTESVDKDTNSMPSDVLAQSLHFYGIQPTVIVNQKSTGFTHLFYGNVQVKIGDDDSKNVDQDGSGGRDAPVIYSSYKSSYLKIFSHVSNDENDENNGNDESISPFSWISSGPVEMSLVGKTSHTVFPSEKFKVYYQIKTNNKEL